MSTTSLLVAMILAAEPSAFDRGLRLARDGRCLEAPIEDHQSCRAAAQAFEWAAERERPGLGALRNLARIRTAMGQYASAAAAYRTLIERASRDPDPERRLWARFAAEELEQLGPRIATLRIEVLGDPEHLELTLDAERRLRPGMREELDGGAHRVVVKRDGVVLKTQEFTILDGERQVLAISAEPIPPPPPEPLDSVPRARAPNRAPWALAGSGAAVAGIGLGLGLGARVERDAQCSGSTCRPAGLDRARALADASTAVTIAGSALAVAGVVWLLVSRRPLRRRPVARGGRR